MSGSSQQHCQWELLCFSGLENVRMTAMWPVPGEAWQAAPDHRTGTAAAGHATSTCRPSQLPHLQQQSINFASSVAYMHDPACAGCLERWSNSQQFKSFSAIVHYSLCASTVHNWTAPELPSCRQRSINERGRDEHRDRRRTESGSQVFPRLIGWVLSRLNLKYFDLIRGQFSGGQQLQPSQHDLRKTMARNSHETWYCKSCGSICPNFRRCHALEGRCWFLIRASTWWLARAQLQRSYFVVNHVGAMRSLQESLDRRFGVKMGIRVPVAELRKSVPATTYKARHWPVPDGVGHWGTD